MEFINDLCDTDNIVEIMNTIDFCNILDENTPLEPTNKPLNVNIYECDICYKIYYCKKYLANHKFNHKNIINKCNLCDKVYKCRSSLNNHLLNHKVKNFKCDLCDKIYRNKRTLTTHINKTHKIKDLY